MNPFHQSARESGENQQRNAAENELPRPKLFHEGRSHPGAQHRDPNQGHHEKPELIDPKLHHVNHEVGGAR